VIREEELERASVSSCRRRNDEVEDRAEVVGRDEWVLGPAEGGVGQVLANGYHEGGREVGWWEVAVCGTCFELAGGNDGQRVDWGCCRAADEHGED